MRRYRFMGFPFNIREVIDTRRIQHVLYHVRNETKPYLSLALPEDSSC